jgi:hypothetical protein
MTLLTEPTRIVLAKGQPVPVDLQGFGSVSLLLHGNGTNGSTTITDSSSNNLTTAATGSVAISTLQKKFGTGSISFDAANSSSKLTVNAGSLFAFGLDPLTIEAWIYPVGNFGSSPNIFSTRNGTTQSLTLRLRFDGKLNVIVGEGAISVLSSASCQLDTWQHVALCRQGRLFSMYIDGTRMYNQDLGVDFNLTSLANIVIGAKQDTGVERFNGFIDDLRITKGIARYTANFTPPTAPFPDI